jgi:hypothetical protein
VTLSFAASAGKVGERNAELSKENTVLQTRAARELGQKKMRKEAAELGLSQQTATAPQLLVASKGDIAKAAARLAVIAGAATATSEGEAAAGEPGTSATGAESASGEEVTTGEAATGEATGTGSESVAGGALSSEELAAAEAEGISPEQAALNKEFEDTLAAEAEATE